MYRITILGSGSSGGVPSAYGDWGSCDPQNPKNRRRRCSILVEQNGPIGTTALLVDTPPDIREQLLSENVKKLDTVLFTHAHADHTHGIDDLRGFALKQGKLLPVWLDAATLAMLKHRFDYCFDAPPGHQPSVLEGNLILPFEPFECEGSGGSVLAVGFTLQHGTGTALGFRIGKMAYTPDVSLIGSESEPYLKDLDVWIVDAMRQTPHPSHFCLDDTLAWVERMNPKLAVLTNMDNDMDYERISANLPANVIPGFDGLKLHTN